MLQLSIRLHLTRHHMRFHKLERQGRAGDAELPVSRCTLCHASRHVSRILAAAEHCAGLAMPAMTSAHFSEHRPLPNLVYSRVELAFILLCVQEDFLDGGKCFQMVYGEAFFTKGKHAGKRLRDIAAEHPEYMVHLPSQNVWQCCAGQTQNLGQKFAQHMLWRSPIRLGQLWLSIMILSLSRCSQKRIAAGAGRWWGFEAEHIIQQARQGVFPGEQLSQPAADVDEPKAAPQEVCVPTDPDIGMLQPATGHTAVMPGRAFRSGGTASVRLYGRFAAISSSCSC